MIPFITSLVFLILFIILVVVDFKKNFSLTNFIVKVLLLVIPSLVNLFVLLLSFSYDGIHKSIFDIAAIILCTIIYSISYNFALQKEQYHGIASFIKTYNKSILFGLLFYVICFSIKSNNLSFASDIAIYIIGGIVGFTVIEIKSFADIDFIPNIRQFIVAFLTAGSFCISTQVLLIVSDWIKLYYFQILLPWILAFIIAIIYILFKVFKQVKKDR